MKIFNILITGGRDFNDHMRLFEAADMLIKEKARNCEIVIISDAAEGAGIIGEAYAAAKGFEVAEFLDDPTAGIAYGQFQAMVDLADTGLCFWNGHSTDMEHMIALARDAGLKLTVIYY